MLTSLAITPDEHRARCRALLERVGGQGLSGVVLFDPHYVLYYSGFAFVPTEHPIAFVLSAEGERALVVPRPEVEHAQGKRTVDRVEHYLEYPGEPRAETVISATLRSMGVQGKVGADKDGYPWNLGQRGSTLSEPLGAAPLGAAVVRVVEQIDEQMTIKSNAEVTLIRESVRWGNLAHTLLQRYTRSGVTRTEVSMRASEEATVAMLDAIEPIHRAQSVFSAGAHAGYRGHIGRNSSALAGNTLQRGDVLVSEATAPVSGYLSELERTMVIGEPSVDQARMFGHMKAAQDVAFDVIRPGALCSDVDKAVRHYFAHYDLFSHWRHHGHAIGLRHHERPFLDSGDHTKIRPGMVFTVEPGLYAPDLGRFRHSDTVLVTDDGIEILTYYPRDLASLTIAA